VAELTDRPDACCGEERQLLCCEASEKLNCCGREVGCGCDVALLDRRYCPPIVQPRDGNGGT
jgi:hypothetical protein